mmetsp:Transcript_7853/g.29405  ORF Transcript_7853/g.29405 Transcript_7853/m.29405 type:complete len:112 (-) Transcript_7853:103-438(-)
MYPFFFPAILACWFGYNYVTHASPSYLMQNPTEDFKDRVRRCGVEKNIVAQIQKDISANKEVSPNLDEEYVRRMCSRFVEDKEPICQYYFHKNYDELVAAATENRRPNCEL